MFRLVGDELLIDRGKRLLERTQALIDDPYPIADAAGLVAALQDVKQGLEQARHAAVERRWQEHLDTPISMQAVATVREAAQASWQEHRGLAELLTTWTGASAAPGNDDTWRDLGTPNVAFRVERRMLFEGDGSPAAIGTRIGPALAQSESVLVTGELQSVLTVETVDASQLLATVRDHIRNFLQSDAQPLVLVSAGWDVRQALELPTFAGADFLTSLTTSHPSARRAFPQDLSTSTSGEVAGVIEIDNTLALVVTSHDLHELEVLVFDPSLVAEWANPSARLEIDVVGEPPRGSEVPEVQLEARATVQWRPADDVRGWRLLPNDEQSWAGEG